MSLAASATVWLHGARLDEIAVRPGVPLEIGPSGQIRVPAPDGSPFLLRAEWTGPSDLIVTDVAEHRHRVGADDALALEIGPVRVELRVVERYLFRRVGVLLWAASLPWFVTVLMFTVLMMQGDVLWRHRCDDPRIAEALGISCPRPSGGAAGVDAEYLARLLRKDYAGEDRGTSGRSERPAEGRKTGDAFIPAGDPKGPKDTPGGAAQVASKPQRTLPPPGEAVAPAPRKVESPEARREDARLHEKKPDPHEGAGRKSDGVDPEAEPTEVQPDEALAEEREGWGLPDWLDTTEEQREIDLMLRLAKHRIRIDPNDPAALGLLSYYQYLADDLKGAEATYDHMIELDPEDAAAYNNKALVYKRRGEYAKEEGLYRVALSLQPEDTTALNNLAVNLAHQGRYDEALAIMQRLETMLPGDPYSDLHRAKIHAQMGKDDEALAFLERALEGMAKLDTLHHIEFRQDIRVDPSLERLRADPRFRAILRRYYGGDTPVPE